MSNVNAPRDDNDIPAAVFAQSGATSFVAPGQINQATGRILVDSAAGGSGTVTSVSVVSANGFAGSVATATTTPAITLSVTTTGLLKGNGTSISAATAGTDYIVPGGALGTPSSGVATNLTGTAAGLTAGTVTTNANLTGPITSSGNATSIAAQTGTGSTFAMQIQPTFTGITTVATISATTTSTIELRATTTTSIKISSGTYPVIQAYNPASGSTCMLDLAFGNYHTVQMPAGNITMGLSHQTTGQLFSVDVVQDSVGSRTVTWFSTIKWAGGTTVTLTTTSNKTDTMVFRISAASSYLGYIAGQNL